MMKPSSSSTAASDGQTESDALRAQIRALAAQAAENAVLYAHAVNSRNSVLAIGRMCSLALQDDHTIASAANAHSLLGPIRLGTPVTHVLRGPDAEAYFRALFALENELAVAAQAADTAPWGVTFASADPASIGLENWVQVPPATWTLERNRAVLAPQAIPGAEHYLVSPRSLIPDGHDFRIEYSASAATFPCDLSLVVGTCVSPDTAGVHAARPDSNGYAFAFGAVENHTTEIQRGLETIAENGQIRIIPGRTHRCVAERVGGQLRFECDGQEVLYALDLLPLLGEACGYVGLYTCGLQHVFWDVTVRTRPGCLSAETRRRLEALRNAVLELPNCPAPRVRIHYLGKRLFVLEDACSR